MECLLHLNNGYVAVGYLPSYMHNHEWESRLPSSLDFPTLDCRRRSLDCGSFLLDLTSFVIPRRGRGGSRILACTLDLHNLGPSHLFLSQPHALHEASINRPDHGCIQAKNPTCPSNKPLSVDLCGSHHALESPIWLVHEE